jgi:hypothetical protein
MARRTIGKQYRQAIHDRGGFEWVLLELAKGRSLRSLAAEIGCSRWWLDRYIWASPQRRIDSLRARVAGGSATAREVLSRESSADSGSRVARYLSRHRQYATVPLGSELLILPSSVEFAKVLGQKHLDAVAAFKSGVVRPQGQAA